MLVHKKVVTFRYFFKYAIFLKILKNRISYYYYYCMWVIHKHIKLKNQINLTNIHSIKKQRDTVIISTSHSLNIENHWLIAHEN